MVAVLIVVVFTRIQDQNGISQLYDMLEIHHSGSEPSNYYICVFECVCQNDQCKIPRSGIE